MTIYSNHDEESRRKAALDPLPTQEVETCTGMHRFLLCHRETEMERENEVEEAERKIEVFESALQMLQPDEVVLERVLAIAIVMKTSS